MKQHHRIISIFLVLCMVFSMLPMQAFASETEPTVETIATETVPEESVAETTVPTEVVPAPTEAEYEPTEESMVPTESETEPTETSKETNLTEVAETTSALSEEITDGLEETTTLTEVESSLSKTPVSFSYDLVEEIVSSEAMGASNPQYAQYPGVNFTNANISPQRKAALTKAMQMVTIKWTSPADFPTWRSSDGDLNTVTATDGTTSQKFIKGKTYTGIPYSMVDNTFDDISWSNAINSGKITTSYMTGTYPRYDNGNTTAHGTDCSRFVYFALSAANAGNIWPESTATMLNSSLYTKISWDELKPADLFLVNGHVMMFVGMSGSKYAVFECDAGDSKCSYNEYTKSWFTKKGYSCYRYNNFNDSSSAYEDLGTGFYAYIINTSRWKHLTNDQNNVSMRTETGAPNQIWYFERQSDGSYSIRSALDKWCLEVWNMSNEQGANVQTHSYNGNSAQQWYITGESGKYVFKAKCSDCVLDVAGGETADGTNIQMWTSNGTDSQLFQVWKLDDYIMAPTVSSDKTTYAQGSSVTLNWTESFGTTTYWINIWKGNSDGEHLVNSSLGLKTSYTFSPDPGTYLVHVEACSDNPEWHTGCSVAYYFTVESNTYTLSYNANGGSGAPGNQTKTHGVNLTLSSTTPTRTGYTFLGWGTSASSNVVLYQPGGTYNSDANVILYAIWKANPVTITSSASSISLQLGGTESQTITVTKDGTYIGNNGRWTMSAQTSDDSIVSSTWGNKTGESSATLTLTAKSVGNATVILSIIDYDSREIIASCQVSVSVTAKTYSIAFDSNGGSNTPASQVKQHGTNLVLTSSEPTGTGYTVTFQGNGGTVSTTSKIVKKEFASWNTEANGSGSSYSPGSIYSANAAVTLYAQWDNAVLGSTTVPTRSDYLFAGWYDSASVDNNGNPTGTMYNASSKITKNTTLYAMWLPEDILLYGDYDRNGVVDITDINSVNKYINGKVDAPYDVEELLLRCDLNRNEKIDTSDYSIMNELRLGTKTQFDMLENYTLTYINKIPNTNYQYGEELNTVGTELNINFNGGSTDYAITEGLSFSGYDPYTLGAQTVTVHFYQFSDTYEVTVSQPKYTVSYNANGGNGAPASQTAVLGSTLTVATTIPTRFGYNFKGWTVKGETEVYYLPGSNISAQTDVELYAVWNKHSISLKNTDIGKSAVNIEYPGVGYYFIVEPEVTTSYLIYSEGNVDSKVYLYNSQGELIAQDDDSGSLNNYRLEVDLQSGETYYIYAKLYSSSHTGSYDFAIRRGYWLTYDANGGVNAPESEYKYNYYDMEISNTEPTRDGYVFQGWSENKDSDIATYQPGDPITTNWGWKLYAVWTPYSVEEHDWQDATCTQPKTCKTCGQTSGTALGHTEKVLPAKAATCTATGLTEGKHCSVCNEVLVAQEIVAALGHTEVIDKAVAATCTENGLTEGKHCSVCGEILVAQTDVAKLGHDYKEITVEPTCTEHGKTTFTCSRCDDEYFTTAPALGHTEVVDKAVAATCTAAGKTEGKHCSVCNAVLVEQETLSALGHKWTAADCDTPKTCSVCKATEGKALGHSYDDNVDGTCNSCGVNRETVEIRQVTHMLRMYNPYTGEHFYTGSEEERDNLVAVGWNYEGVAFTFPGNTGAPVYRLYDPATGEHLYTMDEEEKATLEATGWNYEGIAFNSAYDTEAVQHRLHNPYATVGAYHFTFSDEEKQNLINAGWEYQGIGWYSCWK